MDLLAAWSATLFPAIWPCGCLAWWLWRHRRVRAPQRHRGWHSEATYRVRSRAKPEEVRAKVLCLCTHLRGCRTIAHAFNRWHGNWVTVGKTWVWEFMRAHEAEIRERRRQRKRQKPRAIPVGHTWALDLTLIRSPFGATFTVLGIVDAGSRKLLGLKVLPGKCAFTVLSHLLIAFGTHGLPATLRTHNEAMFTSRLWRQTLNALAIVHRRGPPCQPWRNGRIERLFGTLKAALGDTQPTTAALLQAALDRFAHWYNGLRPHQALDGLTPQEAWQGQTMLEVQAGHAAGGDRVDTGAMRAVVYPLRC